MKNILELTSTAFMKWLDTDEGHLVSFERDRKKQLAATFAAGYNAALIAIEFSGKLRQLRDATNSADVANIAERLEQTETELLAELKTATGARRKEIEERLNDIYED